MARSRYRMPFDRICACSHETDLQHCICNRVKVGECKDRCQPCIDGKHKMEPKPSEAAHE